MTRVGAGSDYYFAQDTLSDLASLDEMLLVRAQVDGQTSGAALFLRSGTDLFYFLGASATERPPGTNNAIFDAAICHGQSEHLTTLHLGGGSRSLRELQVSDRKWKGPLLRAPSASSTRHAMRPSARRRAYPTRPSPGLSIGSRQRRGS